MGLSICFIIYGGGRGAISIGIGIGIGIDMDIGGVLKNGFGILKFAEAPNLFRPRGGIYRGEGGW